MHRTFDRVHRERLNTLEKKLRIFRDLDSSKADERVGESKLSGSFESLRERELGSQHAAVHALTSACASLCAPFLLPSPPGRCHDHPGWRKKGASGCSQGV